MDTKMKTDRGEVEVPMHAHPDSLADRVCPTAFRNRMTGYRYGSDAWNQAWAFYQMGWADRDEFTG